MRQGRRRGGTMSRFSRMGSEWQLIGLRSVSLTRSVQTLAATLLLMLFATLPGLAQVRATLRGHTLALASVAFSHDGKTVASGSHDNTIKLWDVSTGKERAQLNHKGAVRSLAFSHDGKLLASGSNDYTVKLWDVATGSEQATLTGHAHGVRW